MTTTKRKVFFKKIDNEFCVAEVTLSEIEPGDYRFSITGQHGYIVKPSQAKREAYEFWLSYFEESPEALVDMQKRFGCRTASGAAKKVLNVDGEYHGLDIFWPETDDKQVCVTTSFGQIREEIARFFPEIMPYFKWHLNDMHAACEHQEKLGWNNDNVNQPCPTCGYRYGTAWLKRKLPNEVIKWVHSL